MTDTSPLRIADVSADVALLAGGGAAILLQIAHPAVGQAVAEHSDFARRPLDRLNGTLTYLYVTVYGTPAEAAEVARRVGAAHRPVRSASYDARDPQLQLWVAATLYDTAMRVRELVFGPLREADAETLLADYAVIATALGVPRAQWPADGAAFTAYWNESVAALQVTDASRRVAKQLLHPTGGPWWLRPAMPLVRVLTAGLLSEELRIAFALPHKQERFDRIMRFVRVVYPRLPRWVRFAAQRRYLAAFRQQQTKQPEQTWSGQ
ncbi:oxygenase MpaB family protein [Salinibacterium sp. PAMC 21357]|uniref:oxygenase MpaB family protein n=1 Tax=Salinibacterium sp. PAMC 21357 TaxID=1112215 RepID=UPI000289BA18|nr:oxygenase MpaB family protein [Salinibacterium sp. PAMC 21357]